METEFAGCLLMVGPPDVIGSGGDEVRNVRMVAVDEDYLTDQCGWDGTDQVSEILDGPVSSMWYRGLCREWWEEHASWDHEFPCGNKARGAAFDKWWRSYKLWLLENQRE